MSKRKCKFCGGKNDSPRSDFCSNSCRCKDYYYRNHKEQKERVLNNYHETKEDNYERIREINRKATKKYKNKVRFNGKRDIILKKYNHSCSRCGESPEKSRHLHIHHIDGKSYWNEGDVNNSEDNLIVFCVSCHHKLHWMKRRDEITDKDIVRSYLKK